jgi:multicomponent Na+:H+ antiporter subunit A
VLVAAATGVASLVFRRTEALRRRGGALPAPDPASGPAPDSVSGTAADSGPGPASPPARLAPGQRWLLAGDSQEAARRSVILEVVTRLLFHGVILFSVFLLFSGHNAPGGGFAGGLVVGLALVVRYLAGGRHELSAAAPVDAGKVLGAGLFVATGTGLAALVLGGEVLQSTLVDIGIPGIGHLHVTTSVFFDIGVYLVVVGLVLDILRSLGAEVDRQQEIQRGQTQTGRGEGSS